VKYIKSWTPIGEQPKEVNKLLSISKNWSQSVLNYYESQHLYITTDEEAKEGEYCIDIRDNKIFKVERSLTNHYESGVLSFQKSYCKKIIATTDILLIDSEILVNHIVQEGKNAGLIIQFPQIPQSYIQQYIAEYNKGNVITQVIVEYTEKWVNSKGHIGDNFSDVALYEESIKEYGAMLKSVLIINPDNTINIQPIKNSWSKEEVRNILNDFFNDHTNCQNADINKWLEKNL
jgi:hypothetical protein